MTTKHENANLILRLYEIRSQKRMRKARDWFLTVFSPESTKDVFDVLVGEDSAKFRMVVSYWDMAAALVTFESIDEEMFNAINTEHVVVFAKLQPFIAEIRAVPGVPPYLYLKHLEQVVLHMPEAQERIAAMRRYLKSRKAFKAEAKP